MMRRCVQKTRSESAISRNKTSRSTVIGLKVCQPLVYQHRRYDSEPSLWSCHLLAHLLLLALHDGVVHLKLVLLMPEGIVVVVVIAIVWVFRFTVRCLMYLFNNPCRRQTSQYVFVVVPAYYMLSCRYHTVWMQYMRHNAMPHYACVSCRRRRCGLHAVSVVCRTYDVGRRVLQFHQAGEAGFV